MLTQRRNMMAFETHPDARRVQIKCRAKAAALKAQSLVGLTSYREALCGQSPRPKASDSDDWMNP
jgi:hypothetical protein